MKVSAAVVLAVMLAALTFSIRLIGDASFTEPVPVVIPPLGTPAEPQRQAEPVTIAALPDRPDGHARAPGRGTVAAARHAGEADAGAAGTRGQDKHPSAPVYRRVDTVAHAAPAVRDGHGGAVEPRSGAVTRPRPADTATHRYHNGPSGSGSSGTSGSGTSGSGTSDSGTSGSGSGDSGSGDSGSGGDSSGHGSGHDGDDHEEDGY